MDCINILEYENGPVMGRIDQVKQNPLGALELVHLMRVFLWDVCCVLGNGDMILLAFEQHCLDLGTRSGLSPTFDCTLACMRACIGNGNDFIM